MAGRPHKRSVDWFPHDAHASEGKTLTILENHFGAEGYAVWFKLLERIASTDNHIIDCRDLENKEFLAAKFKLSADRMTKILEKMSELGAIDPALWARGYIWCQNLVNNVTPVYVNRKQAPPNRYDLIKTHNAISKPNLDQPRPGYDQPTPDNAITTPDNAIVDPCIYTEVVEVVEEGKASDISTTHNAISRTDNIFSLYERHFGLLTPHMAEVLKDAEGQYPFHWVDCAIEIAVEKGKVNWKYVEGILKNWLQHGFNGHKTETDEDRLKRLKAARAKGPE